MARRRQAVTIKHVAADAGVSLQTVSRVINNEPNVRDEMKAKVQASIDKLGYVPSIAAQRMSGSRSYLILALNDRDRTIADWQERQGADWVDQMLLGGMLKCAEHGYRLIFELVDTHSDHIERELTAAVAALQPDGVVLTPPHSDNPQILSVLEKHNIAFARISPSEEGRGISLNMNDAGAAEMATDHLADLGHERIGFIAGPDEYSISGWRTQGWRTAMARRGFGTADLYAQGDFSFESGRRAATTLLSAQDRPTAIIASNDQMTLATLTVAQEMGLDVPGALSLVSFDNTPVVKFTSPQLTAIDQPIAAVTAKAVEQLIAARKNGERPDGPTVVPATLVERASTAPPR